MKHNKKASVDENISGNDPVFFVIKKGEIFDKLDYDSYVQHVMKHYKYVE